jgi:hypothetical protein
VERSGSSYSTRAFRVKIEDACLATRVFRVKIEDACWATKAIIRWTDSEMEDAWLATEAIIRGTYLENWALIAGKRRFRNIEKLLRGYTWRKFFRWARLEQAKFFNTLRGIKNLHFQLETFYIS